MRDGDLVRVAHATLNQGKTGVIVGRATQAAMDVTVDFGTHGEAEYRYWELKPEFPVSQSAPPREVMRLVRRSGGQIIRAQTRFDTERNGRVLELSAFWPEYTGYDNVESKSATSREVPADQSDRIGPVAHPDSTP